MDPRSAVMMARSRVSLKAAWMVARKVALKDDRMDETTAEIRALPMVGKMVVPTGHAKVALLEGVKVALKAAEMAQSMGAEMADNLDNVRGVEMEDLKAAGMVDKTAFAMVEMKAYRTVARLEYF